MKSKRRIALEPTQAYTLAAGIEPTQAYDMDDSNDGTKEEVIFTYIIPRSRWERNGSVVECLTRDRGSTGLSLTGATALSP